MQFIDDLLNILFPNLCCTCRNVLTKNEEVLCFKCRSELPKTNFQNFHENELIDRLFGKVSISFGIAYLYFYKSGITQKLLHQFKYNNYPGIGNMIGRWIGHELEQKSMLKKTDLIIPVPLHPKKEKNRGYNQSLFLALGISEVTKIPVENKLLKRKYFNESQTLKSKEQRLKSVENAFQLQENKEIKSKNILLVDDVITTGATLEACSLVMHRQGASEIGIATLAMAK